MAGAGCAGGEGAAKEGAEGGDMEGKMQQELAETTRRLQKAIKGKKAAEKVEPFLLDLAEHFVSVSI